ncbi:MAG: hypothetical protein UZ16_OP3001003141 [Candidatus Hinthialibacteria bacterium OLB16]|nr:MAG: hypothetical protein UZ16_OP3001003141 [Candidatus Hinthialibacteria bacterium OLB16]
MNASNRFIPTTHDGPRPFLYLLLSCLILHASVARATPSNGCFQISVDESGQKIRSMKCDPTGNSCYGDELIADGGSIEPLKDVSVKKRQLSFNSTNGTLIWSLPFHREGYYDSDQFILYPNEKTTAGAQPLRLPFRKFVTSTGQIALIEHFMRLPRGTYFMTLNIEDGSQLLLCGNKENPYDLLLTLPGVAKINYDVQDHALIFLCEGLTGTGSIEILPHRIIEVPEKNIYHPQAEFRPDFLVQDLFTQKMLSASEALSDLLSVGVYWNPGVSGGGEWGLSAVETHQFDDPRSWYLRQIREIQLQRIGLIGYDRFEHFGMAFAWDKLPDYGAGGLLNVPENNAAYDMRALHLSAMFIQQVVNYVLAAGDVSLLQAKRSRWLSTDGNEQQPLTGEHATHFDFVLSAGDTRLDRKPAQNYFTLGQIFTASQPFQKVSIRLGVEGNENVDGTVRLYHRPRKQLILERDIHLDSSDKDKLITVETEKPNPPGEYHIDVLDRKSIDGKYFGSSIYWYTDFESSDTRGHATAGPLEGPTVYDRLKVLFDYLYNYTGPKEENLSYYKNDPEYNIPDHKSGRHAVGTTLSYWESPGGGYDAFSGLWYNVACSAMAEAAELMGDRDHAGEYRKLRDAADSAYNKKYWTTFEENGKKFNRYYGCMDWDGVIHDYGFTYNNLEAAYRGITSPEQARDILWWLDRGQISTDLGKTWDGSIYSIWRIAAPFNTIEMDDWQNVTGTLPYREVLTNGGTRLTIAAVDLVTRSRYLSIDNAHERNKEILGRWINPDRLMGGRTFDDPGGRGRWHFGPPDVDRADIEGFREIFPPNGVLSTYQPIAYLGIQLSSSGMSLTPQVPSELDSYTFRHIGYSGCVLDMTATAERQEVPCDISGAGPGLGSGAQEVVFKPTGHFNKAGVQVCITPFNQRQENQLSLSLDEQDGEGWREVAINWYSHARDGQWVWVDARKPLNPEKTCRLRIHDIQPAQGEKIFLSLAEGVLSIKLMAEKTRLEIFPVWSKEDYRLNLGGSSASSGGHRALAATLHPGETTLLAVGKAL